MMMEARLFPKRLQRLLAQRHLFEALKYQYFLQDIPLQYFLFLHNMSCLLVLREGMTFTAVFLSLGGGRNQLSLPSLVPVGILLVVLFSLCRSSVLYLSALAHLLCIRGIVVTMMSF